MTPRPSPAASQGRVFLQLFAALRPHVATDRSLPARLQQLLAREKRFGSRDRRLYRELLYTALRHLPWIDARLASAPDEAVRAVAWLAANTPATAAFRMHWAAALPPVPATIAEKARILSADPAALLPAWFAGHCPAAFESPLLDTLHTRAPLWLRLQTADPAPVLAEFAARGWTTRPTPAAPDALEVLAEADLTTTDAWQNGLIEIQDLGSQLILTQLPEPPAGRWLDACAGAGGKTLQLARLLAASGGRVDAHDIRPKALDELGARAARARLANIRILSAPPSDACDGVLVDAPCSGTGTWRRAPHLKWCTTARSVAGAAGLQLDLLLRHAGLVRPGGLLVYATCSLSRVENDDVLAAFLAARPEFSPAAPARTILPHEHDTDGYFVAPLRRA